MSTSLNQSERTEQAEALFGAGQNAFERGNYREAVAALEASAELSGKATALGGLIQLWLVNAYSAANRQHDAIALGETLAQHPDSEVRKQSKRITEILKAPQLKRRADWLTPIPDLSDLDDSKKVGGMGKYDGVKARTKPLSTVPEPEDLSQMNTRDNGFLWLALAAIVLSFGGLWLIR